MESDARPDIESHGNPLTVPRTYLAFQIMAKEFAREAYEGKTDVVGIRKYPMEAAARPAIEFHGNLVAGLRSYLVSQRMAYEYARVVLGGENRFLWNFLKAVGIRRQARHRNPWKSYGRSLNLVCFPIDGA